MKVKSACIGSMGNNCYLIIDEKTNKSALVDCADDNAQMMDLIGDTELEYILLTHGHYDHIGGVKGIKERFGAKVVISDKDASMLCSSKLSLAAFTGAKHSNVDADILVNDGDSITLGDLDIKVLATPGHTKGSVCYLVEDSLFAGDTLFFCSCGRTDLPGGDEYEMLDSLHLLRDLDGDYQVYPGHDRFSTLDFERKNNKYMNM